ncbi:hypothetical protein [Tahibacter amnicola]|uniref:Uncharacterized protein n=1 Tax=Tahibacter amnicola TaxID=2976241 RepID=A0ABY6BJZ6_9GAMM|nr:hypothetical protein [Tahibacter amnicola]UXI70214.1 hypothetical protein N4264_11445 [Tahibacter amnicola]
MSDATPPPSPLPSRVFGSLAGAFWGAVLFCIGRGFYLAWDQRDGDWGLIGVALSALASPALVVTDMLALIAGPPGAHTLLMLPWMLGGAVLGAAYGALDP